MTTPAIVAMVLSLLLVWGGLVLSILRLRRDGVALDPADTQEVVGADDGPATPARGAG